MVEAEAEILLLRPHLLGEPDEAEAAEFVVGGAGGDGVGLAALPAHILEGVLPALLEADAEALIDQLDLRAEHAAHQDVADPVVDRVVPVDPVLLDQPALEAELGGDGGDLAGVVGLDAADGHQRVAAFGEGFGDEVFELPHLVAAEGQARVHVLALGEDLDLVAEMGREAREGLDRSRAEGELVTREAVEVHWRGSGTGSGIGGIMSALPRLGNCFVGYIS